MPPVDACADPGSLRVTKTITANGAIGTSATLEDGATVNFTIIVKNTGGATLTGVVVTDTFPAVFTGVTGTRTNPDATTAADDGNINSTVTLTGGQQVSWVMSATYEPDECTSLVVNYVKAVWAEANCCDEFAAFDYVEVFNGTAGAPPYRLHPGGDFTAMEVLHYLVENVPFDDQVTIANFINNCGNLADLITASGGVGGAPDGPAVEILDAFGDGTGLFAETSVGT